MVIGLDTPKRTQKEVIPQNDCMYQSADKGASVMTAAFYKNSFHQIEFWLRQTAKALIRLCMNAQSDQRSCYLPFTPCYRSFMIIMLVSLTIPV